MAKATDATRVAIEFLTLWMEDDREAAARHIFGVTSGMDEPQRAEVIAGLLNLNMLTLFELAGASGAGADEIQQWAGDHLRNMSPELPE
jgi:hypothetical protein